MKQLPRISEAEWEVMAVLWKRAPLTAAQVSGELSARSWKLNTVRTLLTRLEGKGAIRSEAGDAGKVFSPSVSREACVKNAGESFLDRVFDGAAGSLLLHFAENKRLSAREIAELEAILAQKRKGK